MVPQRRLLIVDDDPGIHLELRGGLTGYHLYEAADRAGAITALRAHEPGVVLLDLGLPPDPAGISEGISTLETILRLTPETKVIVLTGGSPAAAPLAIEAGAYDVHPQAGGHRRRRPDRRACLRRQPARAPGRRAGRERSRRAAAGADRAEQRPSQALPDDRAGGPGECERGALRREWHGQGGRRPGDPRAEPAPCRTLRRDQLRGEPADLLEAELFGYERGAFTGAVRQTPGKVELANGGTLFLDEVGDLSPSLQAKLLRFLQDRTIERVGGRRSSRSTSGSSAPPTGTSSGDRRGRLPRGSLLPPGRGGGDRSAAARSARRCRPPRPARSGRVQSRVGSRRVGFTLDALRAIDAHPWPGNVRELQNRVKRAVILCEGRAIGTADLDLARRADEPLNLRRILAEAEQAALHRVLGLAQGNISLAAKLLGVSRPRLYDLLRRHGRHD